MNNNVRKLTDGAMMVALLGAFILVNRQLAGLFDSFLALLLPMPLVVYSVKYGWKDGLLPMVASWVVAFLFGTVYTFFYMVTMSITGLFIGNGIKVKKAPSHIMAVSMALAVFADLVTMVLFASFFGYDIQEEIALYQSLLNSVQGAESVVSSIGSVGFIRYLIIGSTVLTGVLEGLLTYLLAILLLKRLRYEVTKPKPLYAIKPIRWTGYVAFLAFIAQYFTSFIPTGLAMDVVIGLGMIGMIYLLIFGCIGFLVTGAIKWHKNMALWLGVGIIFLSVFAVIALCFFGFIYISTDYREKLLQQMEKNGN